MKRIGLTIPISLPEPLYQRLRRLKHGIRAVRGRPPVRNLLGDRDIEWSWVASRLGPGPGAALDFGTGGSHLGLIAAQRGFDVTSVDLGPIEWPYVHPKLKFLAGDILEIPLPVDHFDVVINCSTVEHVGLAGRYGVVDPRSDGDLEAMVRLRSLMKRAAVMLLTIPVGVDAVFAPITRIYGSARLPRLIDGFEIVEEVYWVKDSHNRWVLADKTMAMSSRASAGSWDPMKNVYALGCHMLRRP